MSTTAAPLVTSAGRPALHALSRYGVLTELTDLRQVVENLTPNWYASVMGTGIVAVAAAKLPVQVPGLRTVAVVVWLVAAILLVLLTMATVAHWVTQPARARGHHRDRVMAHFYGAPPMALMTVGAGTLLVGTDVVGTSAAVRIDAVLWTIGTLAGLAVAAVVPLLVVRRHTVRAEDAFGGWLMPVVPPMVSASTGALLLPHLPEGRARVAMLVACYAMSGLSLVASLVVIALIGWRLAVHSVGEARMVPTLWIVLGPLGQSITAAGLLGGVAAQAVPAPYAAALHTAGLVYGIPVGGVAVLWAGVAGVVTLRTARAGLPFSLTWWSFTFPVGTCVTGASGLALASGSAVLTGVAVLLYAALVAAWLVVAGRTARASLRGSIFLAPAPAPAPAAAPVAAPFTGSNSPHGCRIE